MLSSSKLVVGARSGNIGDVHRVRTLRAPYSGVGFKANITYTPVVKFRMPYSVAYNSRHNDRNALLTLKPRANAQQRHPFANTRSLPTHGSLRTGAVGSSAHLKAGVPAEEWLIQDPQLRTTRSPNSLARKKLALSLHLQVTTHRAWRWRLRCSVSGPVIVLPRSPRLQRSTRRGASAVRSSCTAQRLMGRSPIHGSCRRMKATLRSAFDDGSSSSRRTGTIGLEMVRLYRSFRRSSSRSAAADWSPGIAAWVRALGRAARGVVDVQAGETSRGSTRVSQWPVIPFTPARRPDYRRWNSRQGTRLNHVPIIQDLVDDAVEISEGDRPSHFLLRANNRLVVEGAGGAGLAALLAKDRHQTTTPVLMRSRRRASLNLLARVLERVPRPPESLHHAQAPRSRPAGDVGELAPTRRRARTNVIEFHAVVARTAGLGRVGIEMLLEVRDNRHGREVQHHLERAGLRGTGRSGWEE